MLQWLGPLVVVVLHLRSHVGLSASDGGESVTLRDTLGGVSPLVLAKDAGETEVAHFGNQLTFFLTDEYVLWLQVPVKDAIFVDFCHSPHHVSEDLQVLTSINHTFAIGYKGRLMLLIPFT